jgi:hypothetical protein
MVNHPHAEHHIKEVFKGAQVFDPERLKVQTGIRKQPIKQITLIVTTAARIKPHSQLRFIGEHPIKVVAVIAPNISDPTVSELWKIGRKTIPLQIRTPLCINLYPIKIKRPLSPGEQPFNNFSELHRYISLLLLGRTNCNDTGIFYTKHSFPVRTERLNPFQVFIPVRVVQHELHLLRMQREIILIVEFVFPFLKHSDSVEKRRRNATEHRVLEVV